MKVRVASAGTGKTTSLVRRYLGLICAGVPLRRIAGVTFTNAAAAELRQRVGMGVRAARTTGEYLELTFTAEDKARLGAAEYELGGATLSTIHGFMGSVLRLTAPLLGLDPDFSVVGEWEALAIFEEELQTLLYLAESPQHGLYGTVQRAGRDAYALTLKLFRSRSLAEAYTAGTTAGTTGVTPDAAAVVALFDAVYARYRVRLGAKLLTPSEVERRALTLIRHPEALKRLTSRYSVLLVDEFQDVNPLQGKFFRALETGGLTTEVVGDPKQSIYGFRHADVEVFRAALAAGEVQPPLDETRRHATVINRFLNHLTRSFAAQNWGFSELEAPVVTAVGPQAEKTGRVEVHWVTGAEPVADLRAYEAQVLASRLADLSGTYAPHEMAVLAKSHAGLGYVEAALREVGLPSVLLQGRGYYERLEIRDLYHALQVGLEPAGYSLAVWLRSPFAGLTMPDIDAVLGAERPLERLELDFPETFARLTRIREAVRTPPLTALKTLVREPFLGGNRYVDFLEPRARENVDALLFTFAGRPPQEVGVLLERLERLSRQTDAGDVPQRGSGVKLLTVHSAKGLEWPVVAVFDTGRMNVPKSEPLYVSPSGGRVALKGSAAYDELKAQLGARDLGESYRLLYVAASRARDTLLLSGSVKDDQPTGWAEALAAIGFGPGARPYTRPDFVLKAWPFQPAPPPPAPPTETAGLRTAPWTRRTFPLLQYPPVSSPSALKREAETHEPLPIADPGEGERLPGRARTVGTLLHYAVSQNWSAKNPVHLENLRAQEVMFPFSEAEKSDIVAEVADLLTTYEGMLGHGLPSLEARTEDHAEVPVALPHGGTVWQGVIDRFYCAGGVWYLEDYKTDRVVVPEHYTFQLALYAQVLEQVRGITPVVQLVYLRSAQIVRVPPAMLEAAFAETLALS